MLVNIAGGSEGEAAFRPSLLGEEEYSKRSPASNHILLSCVVCGYGCVCGMCVWCYVCVCMLCLWYVYVCLRVVYVGCVCVCMCVKSVWCAYVYTCVHYVWVLCMNGCIGYVFVCVACLFFYIVGCYYINSCTALKLIVLHKNWPMCGRHGEQPS